MNEILKTLEDLKAWLLDIAKSVKEGDNDNVVTNVEKTVELLQKTVDAVSSIDDAWADEWGAGDEWAWEDAGDIEKTVFTAEQAEGLKKFADLYISWDQLAKLLWALANMNVDVEQVFKTVENHSVAIEKLSKGKSQQISKTSGNGESVRDSLDII